MAPLVDGVHKGQELFFVNWVVELVLVELSASAGDEAYISLRIFLAEHGTGSEIACVRIEDVGKVEVVVGKDNVVEK